MASPREQAKQNLFQLKIFMRRVGTALFLLFQQYGDGVHIRKARAKIEDDPASCLYQNRMGRGYQVGTS
ncbi:helix-turn-helix domain-containing protein [Bacillus sp. SL00103]